MEKKRNAIPDVHFFGGSCAVFFVSLLFVIYFDGVSDVVSDHDLLGNVVRRTGEPELPNRNRATRRAARSRLPLAAPAASSK